MSSANTYTAKDIERYHRGEMPAAEMHRLEKAALDDPMLADALEGYTYTNNAAADLHSLQSRLQQRTGVKERKKVTSFHGSWLKVAALFLLLAGGGWLVFQTFSNNGNEFAKTNDSAIEELSRATATDSANTVQSAPTAASTDTTTGLNDLAVTEQRNTSKTSPYTGNASSAPLSATTKRRQAKELSGTTAINKQEELDDKGQASDMLSLRSSAPAEISGTTRDTTSYDITGVQKRNNEQNEAAGNYSTRQTKTKRMAEATSPEPEDGWIAFEKYVTDNLQRPNEALKNEGVELSFDIDNKGKPVNIVVLKSLCERCDAEAIRLLREGPKWKGNKNGGKVKIKF